MTAQINYKKYNARGGRGRPRKSDYILGGGDIEGILQRERDIETKRELYNRNPALYRNLNNHNNKWVWLLVITLLLIGLCWLLRPADKPQAMVSPLPSKVEAKEPENDPIPDIYTLTRNYANIYGVDEDLAVCIMECESSGNTHAVSPSGKHTGAWQFLLSTYKRMRRVYFNEPDARDMRRCPVTSTKTALKAISEGRGVEWECYHKCQ